MKSVAFQSRLISVFLKSLTLLLIFGFFDGLGGMALLAAFWGIWDVFSGMALATFWGRKKNI